MRVIEAGHPVPDAAGLAATFETLALADTAGPDDLVLALISGGASANWIAPAAGLTLSQKQAVTRALLASGASIGEMNVVRKHLSRIKGGRLAERAHPARLIAVAISDVPGDDPSVIGSGPTVPDPTTLADAHAIVARYRLELPEVVTRALADAANETPKPGDAVFASTGFALAMRPADVFSAVEDAARGRRLRADPARHPGRGEARRRAARADGAHLGRAPPRRDPVGRRADRTLRGRAAAANQNTRSPWRWRWPGPGGGAGRRHRRHRRRRRPSRRPGRAFIDDTTVARARRLGLDRPSFLTTTIDEFLKGLAIS